MIKSNPKKSIWVAKDAEIYAEFKFVKNAKKQILKQTEGNNFLELVIKVKYSRYSVSFLSINF